MANILHAIHFLILRSHFHYFTLCLNHYKLKKENHSYSYNAEAIFIIFFNKTINHILRIAYCLLAERAMHRKKLASN